MPAPAHGGPLPTVKFTVVEPAATSPPDVGNAQLAAYGYNAGKEWPAYCDVLENGDGGRYLRWLQPTEADLAKQVEYDMDEQDKLWLDMINAERKRDNQTAVTYEVFEIVMDKIEKEWFDLTRNIPKRTNAMPNEDSKCAICDDGECENSNAIVFCDGCNLAVHQDCYGVPYIPEGQWLCRKCTVSPDKPVICVLCPNSYGAFKQTTTGQWSHLLCAIWVPETGVVNPVYMEPVDGLEAIPKSRWKLVCYLCKKRVGACIQCANRSCYTAFHPTCAREYGLELKMKQGLAAGGDLKAYCDKHGEAAGGARASSPMGSALKRSKSGGGGGGGSTGLLKLTLRLPNKGKSARAYKTSFNSGPPVIPAKIFDRVMAYTSRLKVTGKKDVVNLICRYWSLKREARRGAPLLKRIHLEPWTASATSRQQSEQDKAQKLGLMRLLRNDLERVRMLTELVRKREKKKLERANHVKKTVESMLFPKESAMRKLLQQVKANDKHGYFAQPVSRELVPDYYDIIKVPMDWATMAAKLDRHEYSSALDFADDVHLIINNARRYNKPGTPVHKAAVKLLEFAEPLLVELEGLDTRLSDPSILSHYISQVLTPEDVEDLFAYKYDTTDPQGKIARAADRKAKAAAQAEAAAANAAAGIVLVDSDAEGIDGLQKSKGDGGGAGAAPPRTGTQIDEPVDAMVVDGPVPEVSSSAPPMPKGEKRTADVAGLDGTPRPAARATRSSAAAAAEQPLPKREPPATRKPPAPRASTSRTQSQALARQGSPLKAMPEFLDEPTLDPKATFQHFEAGWILPAGSSRRRSSVGGASEPPEQSRKTPRTENARLAAVAEAEKAVEASPAAEKRRGKGKAKDEPDVVAEVPAEGSEAPASPSKPAGDSPRKPRTSAAHGRNDNELITAWEHQFDALSASVPIRDKSQLEDGTLVWARSGAFPFFPAEVADLDADDTPDWLKDAKPKNDTDKVPVMFFDGGRSGGWIPRSLLRLLGESRDLDQHLLDPLAIRSNRRRTKKQGSKTVAQSVNELTEAYETAMSLAEVAEEQAASKGASTAAGGKRRKKAARRSGKGR